MTNRQLITPHFLLHFFTFFISLNTKDIPFLKKGHSNYKKSCILYQLIREKEKMKAFANTEIRISNTKRLYRSV